MKNSKKFIKISLLGLGVLGVVLLVRFCLPLVLPFLVGLGVALAAEPLTRLLERRLPRPLSSGISMVVVYGLLCLGVFFLGRFLLMELNRLTGRLPELAEGTQVLLGKAELFFQRITERAPENLRQQMKQGLEELLSSGAELTKEAAGKVLGTVSRMVLRLPDALIFLVTAVTSGFLISARLHRLKPWLAGIVPAGWRMGVGRTLSNMKRNLLLWLRAQCKLLGLTFCLLFAGFFVLRVKNAPATAALVTLVDALPVLGIGTILLPWAVMMLVQGQTAFAVALGSLYVVVTLVRSALEPRLVGRQLGLSPLLTLAGIYIGYRLWGILGMILAPVLLIALGELLALTREGKGE